jgi:hypothetical protein
MEMKQNPFSARSIILILLLCFISGNIMAQKVKLDSLDIDQLNMYKDKAVTMRNAGIILTSCGVGIMVIGYYIGITYHSDEPEDWTALAIVGFSGIAGIATAVVGIPLWGIGSSRKDNAEFYLLDIDEYREMAVARRNTGMILTLSGIAVAVTGIIIYASARDENGSALGVISGMVGIATTIVGIPMWAAGDNRKAKAELTLQKFNVVPENSMALGLGITIMF